MAWLTVTAVAFVLGLLAWYQQRLRGEGAAEERAEADAEKSARLKRQNEVALRPVSDEKLQKSLRDGTF